MIPNECVASEIPTMPAFLGLTNRASRRRFCGLHIVRFEVDLAVKVSTNGARQRFFVRALRTTRATLAIEFSCEVHEGCLGLGSRLLRGLSRTRKANEAGNNLGLYRTPGSVDGSRFISISIECHVNHASKHLAQ